MNKMIKYFLYVGFVILLFSCKKRINKELYGSWAVLEVFYGDVDISGIDRSANVIVSNSLMIDASKNVIVLPINSNKREYGYIKSFEKDGFEWIKIYNATDKRFNGDYLIHLKKEKSFSKGRNQRYSLVLESKNIYIQGEKTVVSF